MTNKTDIYTIYDKLAEEAGGLFEAKNETVAIRMFKQFLKNDLYAKTDYKLLKMGTFDREKPEITSIGIPIELTVMWSPAELGEE